MKQSMNYITSLPDFMEMQRVSFCWFIAQGLNEELEIFSRIHDFSYNTEYVLFGNEYSLVKPIYNVIRAKKYTANYAAQLVIPLEIRNKKLNSIRYHNQFPIINLPLMTTSATFIINGCERVIVSQIIRSPGIYFEKNKNQKKRKLIKRKLSSDINKLRNFVPLGEPFISEQILSFFPITYNQSLFQYSFNELKRNEKDFYFYFLESFKIYQIISKTVTSTDKHKRIKIFLHWLNLKKDRLSDPSILFNNNKTDLLVDWNSLLKSLLKYELLNHTIFNNFQTNEKDLFDEVNTNYLDFSSLILNLPKTKKTQQLAEYYNKIDKTQFNNQLLLILVYNSKYLGQINQFKFLNKAVISTTQKLQTLVCNTKSQKLKPAFYFSKTLKELFKYKQKKKKSKEFENIRVTLNPKFGLNTPQINDLNTKNSNINRIEYKYELNEKLSRLILLDIYENMFQVIK